MDGTTKIKDGVTSKNHHFVGELSKILKIVKLDDATSSLKQDYGKKVD